MGREGQIFAWFERTYFMDGPISIDDTPKEVRRKKSLVKVFDKKQQQ